MKKHTILKLCLVAILASLSIALNYLKVPITPYTRVTFYALPLLFAGCFFDTKYSILTGALTGIVLQLLSEYGISLTSPFWALAPIGWTLSANLIYKLLKNKNIFLCSLIVTITSSLVATLLNTIAMLMEGVIMNDDYYTLAVVLTNLPSRLLIMLIMIVPYTLLLFILIKRVLPIYLRNIGEEKDVK